MSSMKEAWDLLCLKTNLNGLQSFVVVSFCLFVLHISIDIGDILEDETFMLVLYRLYLLMKSGIPYFVSTER